MLEDDSPLQGPEPVDQSSARRRSRIHYGWRLLAAAMFISVVPAGVRGSFTLFRLPMSEDLGWSYTALGGAWALGLVMNGVTQPITGHLFDRFGARKVILICVVATGLATAGLYWISHYWHVILLFSFVFSIAMGGVSLAILWPLAARWFVKRLGLALGLLTAGNSIASTVLVPAVTGLVIAQYGWRVAWLALGVVPLLLALPVGLRFLRNWPSDIGLKPDGDPETPMEAQRRGSSPALQRGGFEVDRWWRAFRAPTIWALLPGLAAGGLTASFISRALVSFATDQGIGLSTASNIHAVMVVLGAAGAIAGGWLSDRFPRKRVLGAIYLAQGIAFLVLAVGPGTLTGLWVFAVVGGLCSAAWMPIAFGLVVDVYGLRALGAIWGIAFLSHHLASLAFPVLSALAHGLAGIYASPFVVWVLMLVMASIPVFAINEKKYSSRYEAAVAGGVWGN